MRRDDRAGAVPVEAALAEFATLAEAEHAAGDCRRCDLYRNATQTVFGEGGAGAAMMLVGEQPGDQEDMAGKPFVGPAGRVLAEVLEAAGIDRRAVYITNAVKHFKFEPRGKKRIHKRPNAGEVAACRFWLRLERRLVRPRVIVALGATAVQALVGRPASIRSLRGRPLALEGGGWLFATVHPSFLLRMPDREKAHEERERFVDDLRAAWAFEPERHEKARQVASS